MFLLDASCLIQLHRQRLLPGLLELVISRVELLYAERLLWSTSRVLWELTKGSDSISQWAKRMPQDFFLKPTPQCRVYFREIVRDLRLSQYELSHIARFVSGADAMLVATARTTDATIVTQETSEARSTRPKLPDVGQRYGVDCCDFRMFLERPDIVERVGRVAWSRQRGQASDITTGHEPAQTPLAFPTN